MNSFDWEFGTKLPPAYCKNSRKKIKRSLEFALVSFILSIARVLPRGLGQRVFGFLGSTAGRVMSRRAFAAQLSLHLLHEVEHHPGRRTLRCAGRYKYKTTTQRIDLVAVGFEEAAATGVEQRRSLGDPQPVFFHCYT